MNEFVDKDGTVYHKGKEMPELKGTRPITVIKPKKKTKRRTRTNPIGQTEGKESCSEERI